MLSVITKKIAVTTGPHFFQQVKQTNFINSLLNSKADSLNKIYTHPFNQELFAGTLNKKNFGQYLRDDQFYLGHFSAVLKKLYERTNNSSPQLSLHLSYFTQHIISDEQKMQLKYREYFINHYAVKPSRVITSYVYFLNTQAEKAPLPVAISSVLPCFWIYYKLGSMQIRQKQLMPNPYEDWIATYSSPKFVTATQDLAKVINELANQSQSEQRLLEEMQKAFGQAVEFELAFTRHSYGELPATDGPIHYK